MVSLDGERSVGYRIDQWTDATLRSETALDDLDERACVDELMAQVGARRARANQALLERWKSRVDPLLLLVEPDEQIADAIKRAASAAGFATETTASGAEALVLAGQLQPEFIALNIDSSEMPVETIIRALSTHLDAQIAVGVLNPTPTAVAEIRSAGAHEIVHLPFQEAELTTLLAAAARTARESRRGRTLLTIGPVTLDSSSFVVTINGRQATLALRQFELLQCLMQNYPRVLGHDELRREVWKAGPEVSSEAIKTNVRKLRVALEGAADVVAVRNQGYRLEIPTAPA